MIDSIRMAPAVKLPSNAVNRVKRVHRNHRVIDSNHVIIRTTTQDYLLSVKCLDPGSGWKIPAIWHGAGACLGVFMPET